MSFKDKIVKYLELTKQESSAKNQKKTIADELKAHVKALEGQILIEDGFEVTVRDRGTVLDEEKLVKILKKMKRKDLIKKIEVPNVELIETLIYNQELDPSFMAEATSPKQKDVISVKAIKMKEEREDGEN